jgi:transcriptional regulator with XRE-family HTH domain
MPTKDSSFYRRRVRETLRRAREAAQLTQREAAARLDWSESKLVRVEAGTVGLSTTDLSALLRLYKFDDEHQAADLTEMVRASRQRPWYNKYQGILTPAFSQYLGYESAASAILGFQPLAVPGLLQTDDYTRAVLEASRIDKIDERISLRARRQELLERDDCPDLIYILDEAALHRWIGGPAVMRCQLRQLKNIIEHSKISLRIVPFSAGAHAGITGSFTILEFSDWDEDVLYLETAGGNFTSREDQELVAKYRDNFEQLKAMSLEGESAANLIEDVIHGFSSKSELPS